MNKEKGIIRPEEEPSGLVPYKPEDQVFQRLCLCNYLKELPEVAEEKDEEIEKPLLVSKER